MDNDAVRLRLRPFRQFVSSGTPGPAIEIAGLVDRDHFIVTALAHRVPLQTLEIGSDATGPFAIVTESEIDAPSGLRIRIEPEYEEDLGAAGASLTLVLDAGDRAGAEAALRARGIDPVSVNLLGPAGRAVTLYFDGEGHVDGHGAIGPAAAETSPH